VVFAPDAAVDEQSGHTVREEFQRRVRIGAGNFQALGWYWRILDLRRGIQAYTFFSHKIIRWFFPFLMLGTLACSLVLYQQPLFAGLFWTQILFYLAAWIGWMSDCLRHPIPVFTRVYHFTAMNIALLAGFFKFLHGIRSAAWEPTTRQNS
jgi:hypothetical protein